MLRKSNFLERLLTTTSVFTDAGDSGGGGGSTTVVDSGPAVNESDAGIGGAQEQDYDFGYSHGNPTAEETARVTSILDPSKDQDRVISSSDISALLGWNPSLAPKKPAQTPAAQQTQAAPAPASPSAAPAPAAQPAPSPLDPNVKALTESVATLVESQQQLQQPAQTQTETPKPKRFYGDAVGEMQVAPELVAALVGTNDPQALAQAVPAINHLVNSMMNRVMEDAVRVMQHQSQQILQHIPQAVVAHTTERSNTQRFFDRYQELNKPALAPIVNQYAAAVVAKLQKEGKQIVYDDAFFDTVGGLVHGYVKQTFGVEIPRAQAQQVAIAPVASVSPSKPQAARARFVTPLGTRPPAGPGGQSQSADLRDLV